MKRCAIILFFLLCSIPLMHSLGIGLYFEKYSNYRDVVLFLDCYF